MTREEYMKQLQEAIKECSSKQQADILADFNEHFDMGMAQGHSEEEIAESLGDISLFIDDLVVEEETLPALSKKQENKINKIIVDSDMADIEVVMSDKIDCDMINWKKTDSSYYDFSKRIENQAVIYELKRKPGNMFMNFHTPKMLVKMVAGFDLEVKTALGDIQTEFLNLNEGEFTTNQGDIEFTGIANLIKIQTSQGDTKCTGKIKQLDVSTSQGDIEIESQLLKRVKAVSQQGDIDLNIELAESLEVSTRQGDIEGNVNAAYISAESKHGDVELAISNTRKATLKTSMGDIQLGAKELEDFEITASTSLGSIECDLDDVVVKGHTYRKGEGKSQIILKTSFGDIEITD